MRLIDCAVIGGGPAGLTAALYLKRFRRHVVLFQSGKPRAAWIPKTRNLIGYHLGISGHALLRRLRRQVSSLKVPMIEAEARIFRDQGLFSVRYGHLQLLARKIILATGIGDEQPSIEGIENLRKKGFFRYCPICDGFEHCGKKIFLLVGREDCLGKIRFLLKYTSHLLVIGPPDYPLSAQRKNAYRKLGVKYIADRIESVQVFRKKIRVKLAEGAAYAGDAAYVELGFRVNESAVAGLKKLKRTKDGRFSTNKDQRTSIPGIFAIGDCAPGLAQIAVGAGQAAIAATAVHNELLESPRPARKRK